ncbi:cysteine hydrolase family protein [Plesiomonas shigelloides]|uniref:cysteine hydrolase family protein n=1 Tax=Plesiomonas shigelloides TaxID=703 RepID=UPI00387F2783
MEKTALLIIDLQNDYFAAGAFPLWQAEVTKDRIVAFMHKAQAAGVEIIHVQHIADPALGLAPFFNQGTTGAEIHPDVLAAAPNAPIVVKTFADGFVKTTLEQVLSERGVSRLWVAGMMTQNCVTHTAISRSAEKYDVAILPDLCTTVSEMLHLIALHAVSTRMALTPSATLLP